MRSLRIAMVAPCPFPTSQGTQVFIGQLARALRGRGHRVHLITYHFGDKNLNAQGLLYRSWPVPISGKLLSGPSFQKLLFDGLLAMKLDQVVQRQRADIIHAHNYEGGLVGLAVRRLRKVPLVFHTHNTMTHELPSYSRSRAGQHLAGWLGQILDDQVPRRADACIAVTSDIAAFLRQHGAVGDKTWSIPPAIEANQFPEEQTSARVGASDWHLVYAGNLDGYQNFDLILSGLQEVVIHHPQCLLDVVTNSSTARFRKQVNRMGLGQQVCFTETTSFGVMRGILKRSDLALCPPVSPYGFPIKLLNYLAAGKPVVICAGSANGIRHKINGWVVKDNDVEGFARGIMTLMRDHKLRHKLSLNARKTAREKFSWERLAPRYEEVYCRTLENWNPRS